MEVILRRIFYSLIFFLITGAFFIQKANAASLISVSDTLSTSRPSAATTLTADQAAGAGSVQVLDQNSTMFLASDSATLWPDTSETLNIVNVASMSASAVPSAGNRIIYFTDTAANAHHLGDAITVAVTATHQIKFTPVTTIPSGGKIIITFPGSGQNTASPSANGFSFNGESATPTDVQCYPASACGGSIASNQLNTFTLTTNGIISGGTTVYVDIGCSAQTSGVCTTFAPRLINPTKTAAAGSADSWKVTIQTQDNNSVDLDYGALKAATIESVTVQATVEPTITFTIAGITDGTTYNSVNSSCGVTDKGNAGITPSATNVNLGLLSNTNINTEGQTLTVSTNGSAGYVITATSSGHFINPSSGFWLPDANGGSGLTANDTPTPGAITANTPAFGISPCGAHVPTSSPNWGGSTGQVNTGGASTALFSNPWDSGTNGYYATIASYTGGPVSSDQTVVRYAATINGTTPAGIYTTVLSYVATATF